MEWKRILENYLFGSIKAKVIPGDSWHFRRRRFEILVNVLSRMMFLCVLLMLLGALNPDSTCTHFWMGVSVFCSTFYIYKRDVRSGVIGWSTAYDMKSVFFSFFRNPTYNETKAIEITAKNYERADLSFVSTFLELGFTFTAQNKTDLTQHFTMLPCPEGTYSMGTLGCVECPPGKSVNVIVLLRR